MLDWSSPKYIDLPNLRMAYWEAGERSHRPSIILCHGFPEIAYSWRHIIPALAQAGFHVIAPDQRGYGFTGPALNDRGEQEDVALYDMAHLCEDLENLAIGLDINQAIYAGHDWGGIVIWQLPFLRPDKVAGLIGVNTPFIPRMSMDPIQAFRGALGEDMYIVAFQDYGVAEAKLEEDIRRSLRCFYRKEGLSGTPEGPWVAFELLNILNMDEKDWPGEVLLSDQDLEVYARAFERNGFRGPVNWYRNFTRNWEKSADFRQSINLPSLMICAENDAVLPPSMADGMAKYVFDLEKHIIADCGHWTQTEKPEDLSNIMIDWLTRRFV